jgi:hypothetical protein
LGSQDDFKRQYCKLEPEEIETEAEPEPEQEAKVKLNILAVIDLCKDYNPRGYSGIDLSVLACF